MAMVSTYSAEYSPVGGSAAFREVTFSRKAQSGILSGAIMKKSIVALP